MSRIHIGEKNGRMGMWIAPPGGNASGEGRQLLSSDYDYLKIHQQGRVRINSVAGTFGRTFPPTPIPFPALPYIPTVWVNFGWEWYLGSIPVFYPGLTTYTNPLFNDQETVPYEIHSNRLVIFPEWSPENGSAGAYIDVYYIIFKNKAADSP